MKYQGITIGVPKEIMENEGRVALTPENVKKLVDSGARLQVESNAGAGSYYSDDMYKAAGATIVSDCVELYANNKVIMKVKEPQFNKAKNMHEVQMMKPGTTLICFLHPASPSNWQMVKDLAQRDIVALTLDGIPRFPESYEMDPLISMSIVAGYKGLLMAAGMLPRFMGKVDTVVGKTQGAKVLVVGAGVAGRQSIITAKSLGADVYALDINPQALKRAEELGAKPLHFEVPDSIALNNGSSAKRLPEEWYDKMRQCIRENLVDVDIVVLSALVPNEKAPILVTAEMVKEMKNGSVIVDISVDQGGNCELTKAGEIYEIHHVKIIGTKNIPGSVPQDATWLFSHNILAFFDYLVKDGKVVIDPKDKIVKESLVTWEKEIVHHGTLVSMKA